MKSTMNVLRRLLTMIICVSMLFSIMPVNASKNITVVFVGNTKHANYQVKTYPHLVNEYLSSVLDDAETDLICADPLNLEQKNFMDVITEQVLTNSPDMVFIELSVSHKYTLTESELKSRIETVIQALTNGDKIPAVYFIYTPEETFRNNRKLFDDIASYYDIGICDVYSDMKNYYVKGKLETKDFLTAGVIPGEDGHEYYGKSIVNTLRGIRDLLKPIKQNERITEEKNGFVSEQPIDADVSNTESATLYVDIKSTSDKADGSLDNPFISLNAARDEINRIKIREGASFKGATVYIREGIYRVGDGFVLTEKDSGTKEAPIIYSGYPGEKVRIMNAVELKPEKFKTVTDSNVLDRLPTEALGKVMQYDLAREGLDAGIFFTGTRTFNSNQRDFSLGSMLIVDDIAEQRASYPNGGLSAISQKQQPVPNKVYYDEKKGEKWKTADNAWLKGRLSNGWYTEYNKIKSFDFENQCITLSNNSSANVTAGFGWGIVNLIEELDIPSEWYADESTNILYYYPRRPLEESEILFTTNTNSVIKLNNASYITLKNMIVEGSCGNGIEMLDGYGNTIDNCEVRNVGYRGISIENTKGGSKVGGHGVINSHIHSTAMAGIYFQGGDAAGQTPSQNYVENCHIENASIYQHTPGGGVVTEANATYGGPVGVAVRYCNIHNDNSPGLYPGGTDDLYEYNELYNLARDCDDYGAVYGSARGAVEQGLTYRYNYMHDCVYNSHFGVSGFYAGFYTDALRLNGSKVINNVFVNVQQPIFFSYNHNQTARENLLLDSVRTGIYIWDGGMNKDDYDNFDNELQRRLDAGDVLQGAIWEGAFFNRLLYRSYFNAPWFNSASEKTYYLKYPWLEHYLEPGILMPKYNFIENNSIINTSAHRYDIIAPIYSVDYNTYENNYITQNAFNAEKGETEYDRIHKAMKLSKEKLGDFEIWDVTQAGLKDEPSSVGEFEIIAPVNGQKNIEADNLVLRWDFASGADEYRVVIATDPDFNNIVFDKIVLDDYVKAEGLASGAKKYYWKVTAASQSEQFYGTPENSNGVQTFYTSAFEEVDKTELNKAIEFLNEIIPILKEGEGPGCCPEGTIETLKGLIEQAHTVNSQSHPKKAVVESLSSELKTEGYKALASVRIEEIDIGTYFSDLSNLYYRSKNLSEFDVSGEESPHLSMTDNGAKLNNSGGMFTKEKIKPWQVSRFTGTFDFGGTKGYAAYMMFGIRLQETGPFMYNETNYSFLVTPEGIELQGFKPPSKIGAFLVMKENTCLNDGKPHDIEFAAVAEDDDRAVRIVLRVDGKIIFNHVDRENVIKDGGHVGIWAISEKSTAIIGKANTNADYPSLVELLEDSQSEIYVNE